jgi:hypothetical protein
MGERETSIETRERTRPTREELRRVYERCEATRRRSRETVLRALNVPPVRPGWQEPLRSTEQSTGDRLQ